MSVEVWVAIASVGVAVLVAVQSVVFGYSQWRRSRRSRVEVKPAYTQLLRPGPTEIKLEITLANQITLSDPYSATISLTARKPRDITSASFNERALRIEFGAPIVALLNVSGHPDGQLVVADWRESYFEQGSGRLRQTSPDWKSHVDLPPALIAADQPWTVTAICEGQPKPWPSTHLTDVDWVASTADEIGPTSIWSLIPPIGNVLIGFFLGFLMASFFLWEYFLY